MEDQKRFGGTGNFLYPSTARNGRILFAGEAAGFQDALWGFGMRYAMLSGHLAARALIEKMPERYERLWKKRLGGIMRTSIVNRYFYERLGDTGYNEFMRRIGRAEDAREWLRVHYAPSFWKSLWFPIARKAIRSSRKETARKSQSSTAAIETRKCWSDSDPDGRPSSISWPQHYRDRPYRTYRSYS